MACAFQAWYGAAAGIWLVSCLTPPVIQKTGARPLGRAEAVEGGIAALAVSEDDLRFDSRADIETQCPKVMNARRKLWNGEIRCCSERQERLMLTD